MTKAVILARGLGTRMRRDDAGATLSQEQASIAGTGVKALISVGRPFVDYLLSSLASAGIRRVCLVIGPEHDAVRKHIASLPFSQLSISFAVQEEAKGTADAVRSAKEFAANEPFLMINSDSYYPISALRSLVELEGCGLVGFTRSGLAKGNIEPERIRNFAVAEATPDGYLKSIVEKPTNEQLNRLGLDAPISMNCWRFDRTIFTACESIGLSERGEYELPTAVEYSMKHLQTRYRIAPCDQPVLDMTSRRDIQSLTDAMSKIEVTL